MNIVYSQWFYLFVLLLGISGLILTDAKLKLVFFYQPRAAVKTIASLIVILLLADIVGIKLGIFFTNQHYVTGMYIVSPNLPIEELVFLFLLSYVTLLVFRLICQHRKSFDV